MRLPIIFRKLQNSNYVKWTIQKLEIYFFLYGVSFINEHYSENEERSILIT